MAKESPLSVGKGAILALPHPRLIALIAGEPSLVHHRGELVHDVVVPVLDRARHDGDPCA
ncbi:hypothetical protein HMPREF1985_00557 [Mitsuokella sp. oral taxon 131 str. W9106]|nr:hypothetical protein HMPREF1985_00557 [Mitsuokella sp. oral taxon 131 str. W9106]